MVTDVEYRFLKSRVTKFVVIVPSDFSSGYTPELMRDLDEMRDCCIEHYYDHGCSRLVMTCQEVKYISKDFGHNFWFWIG